MSDELPSEISAKDLLREIIAKPETIRTLDVGTMEVLSKSDVRIQFFQLFANPFLKDIPVPPETSISLEIDGEKLFLHVECDDGSPIAIVTIPETANLNAVDLLTEDGQKKFFGILAKNIQMTTQSDDLPFPEKGRKNNELAEEQKREMLFGIAEKMLEKTA